MLESSAILLNDSYKLRMHVSSLLILFEITCITTLYDTLRTLYTVCSLSNYVGRTVTLIDVRTYLVFDVLCSVGIHESVEGLHEVPVAGANASNHQCSAVCVVVVVVGWGGGEEDKEGEK